MAMVGTGMMRSQSPLVASSSLSNLPPFLSADAQTTDVRVEPLLEELKCVAHNSVENSLHRELEQARSELAWHHENEDRRQKQQDDIIAADVAGIQSRLGQMHAGNLFDKMSFKRNARQCRYVRLTFDCRRVEWAQNQR